MEIIISPSILSYENDLENSLDKIEKMIENEIKWLHIDVMRKPFVPNDRFSIETIKMLYDHLRGKIFFDFHLMVDNPHELINSVSEIVGENEVSITIHIESFRDFKEDQEKYNSKDFDLLNFPELKEKDAEFKKLVGKTLMDIKQRGYRTGISLEPGTSVDNLPEEIMNNADLVLLMSVCSGKGGQEYQDRVTEKIKELREKYPDVMVQVDGGINNENISRVVQAGANNVVIGSYITRDDPVEQIKKIKEKLVLKQ